jgi:small subunit ribosomal protein S13
VARIAGVDLPRNKRVEVGLTYIFGIGRSRARSILSTVSVDPNRKTDQLGEDEVAKIREFIEKNVPVEGELRRTISMNIKRLMDLGTYRGLRHRKSLPVRGQRTHTNARTRKGPRKTVAVRKQLKVMK